MRMVLFLAVLANSLDLFATAVGIHWFGNREGNPLLAPLAEQHWLAFVAIKGALVPLLIWRLYRYRRDTPRLSTPMPRSCSTRTVCAAARSIVRATNRERSRSSIPVESKHLSQVPGCQRLTHLAEAPVLQTRP